MPVNKTALAVFSLWMLDFLFLSGTGGLRLLVSPLLLFLIFIGFRLPSTRFLWAWGAGLGLLQDLATGGSFGAFACTYALVGWGLGGIRHMFEREDPLVQGVWAGILAGAALLLYGLVVAWSDPAIGWHRWIWWMIPLTAISNGVCAVYGFPRLQRFLRR